MSSLKTLKLAHLPHDLSAYVGLYDSVKNAAFLQQQLLEGNQAYEYAFIDASVVCLVTARLVGGLTLTLAKDSIFHSPTSCCLSSCK